MNDSNEKPIDRLTVFTFLWACQALVHQEFFPKWIDDGNVFGWMLVVFAVITLLNPHRVLPLVLLASTSTVFNVLKWPFVVNHILVETIVNLAILGAVFSVLVFGRNQRDGRERERIVDKFCPVVVVMLVGMYYFAFLAKLNWDFLNPDISCAGVLYGDLVERFPFMPSADWAKVCAIWGTILIELILPVGFTFKKTQHLTVILGILFHLMLGLIGYRTFSSLAAVLYSLFLIKPLAEAVTLGVSNGRKRLGEAKFQQLVLVLRVLVVTGIATLMSIYLFGHYRSGFGPLKIFRISWVIWVCWSLAILCTYASAMVLGRRKTKTTDTVVPTARPGLLWLLMIIVLFNGTSQYLGLKTETCFTMYSNLRTEGGHNNHLFLPALRLADYQDDLIDVLETDHPALHEIIAEDQLMTHFEFHRILSETVEDFFVRYTRGDQESRVERVNGVISDYDYAEKHPLLLRKLLFFRPVDKGEHMRCHH